ncbi:hypothetical protein OPT61_g1444 [Boeremia exigua]|uniref:Uncharacterized protein n=1 Tax=Boeremia exigua TaxID=749465 RepID=A0ACC2IQH4_9PLEO|nr:hypothetical protein OPT61_g1444 [Boeremia exigua]
MADAEPTFMAQIFERLAYEFAEARPMLPTYLHLIASALFPIYTGAHASLSRPSTAAKPSKKQKRRALERNGSDTEDGGDSSDEEDEEEQHNMEGLSPKDAILMPLFAGIALSGLYFLLKWMNDPTLLNKILNAYFAIFGVFSVSKLVTDILDIGHSIIFPQRHVIKGTLYHVNGKEEKAIPASGNAKGKKVLNTPFPGFLASLPLNNFLRKTLWNDRAMPANKWSLKLYVHRALAAKFKIGAHSIAGTLTGLCVVAYFNFVDKPWYLTNLLGFGFSYGALQLMSPTTFATGSLILGALFFYDIYFVFYTPMMVTVAKSLDVPIKLMFPRPGDPKDPTSAPSHAMLGLGDVVLPGIVIGLALRFDLYLFYLRRQKRIAATSAGGPETVHKSEYFPLAGRWSDHFWTHSLTGRPLWTKDDNKSEAPFTFPKTYFKASLAGYVLGLLATLGVMMIWDHAQPALLYLVPGVLGSIWLTAAARGELSLMWNYTEAIDEEEDHKAGNDVGATNITGAQEHKRVTRSQSKATKDSSRGSDGEDGANRPRRSRRSRPEREIFSFTIEAPTGSKKSKTNNKHARSSTTDASSMGTKSATPSRSTAVDTGAEPAVFVDPQVEYEALSVSRKLWIDALGIDQKNSTERCMQVSVMHKIYASTVRVVAWLGEEKDRSDDAFALLQGISRHVKVTDWSTLALIPVGEDKEGWSDIREAVPWQYEEFRTVFALFSWPYFTRVWVQQEVHLARKVVLQCGCSSFAERDFWLGLSTLALKPVSTTSLLPISRWDWVSILGRASNLRNYRLILWGAERAGIFLVTVRHYTRQLSCQDGRDKIYALLGLLSDQNSSLQIIPDYSRSIEEVYKDVTDPSSYGLARTDLFQDLRRELLRIDGYMGTQLDRKTRTYITDPTVPLKEAGIKVESYVRDPRRLIVLPETLRAAGVAVEDIVLV